MYAKRKDKNIEKNIIMASFFLLLFAGMQFGISSIYGPILFPDEIGYWGVAAAMNGYDWSEVVSLNSYYSYGYGIILSLILTITDNAIIAYRIAIYFNFALMGISFLLLFKITNKLFPHKEEKESLLYAICGICYSTFIFFVQVSMTEILLMTLYLCIVRLLISYLENFKSITAIGLVIAFVYLYFVHMRTIAIVIAGIFTAIIIFCYYPKSRRSLKTAFVSIVLFAVLGMFLKMQVTDTLYAVADFEKLAGNDYAGQISKIKDIFSLSGGIHFLISIVGKVFYLGLSTFGLVYYAVYFLIKKVFLFVKKKEKQEVLYVFLLLAFLGQFAITAIYMTRGSVIDATLYGRYHEMILPIMIVLGLIQIFETKQLWKKTICIMGVQSLLLGIVLIYWNYVDASYRHSLFIVGANFAANQENFNRNQFVLILFIAGIVFYCMLTGLVLLIKKRSEWTWLLSLFILAQVLIGLDASKDYIYFHNSYSYTDILLGQELQEIAKEGKEICFLQSEGAEQYIGLIQMPLMKYSITVLKEDDLELLSKDSVVLAFQNNLNLEELQEMYDKKKEARLFTAFYNP